MKRLIALLITVIMLISGCAPSVGYSEDTVEEVESLENLCEQSGLEIKIPSTARNSEFRIINNYIAESKFSFNTVIFTYRASKITSGEQLSGIAEKAESETELDLGERAEVTVYTYKDGSREATWYVNGTYNSLYTENNATNDLLTEICDLIV